MIYARVKSLDENKLFLLFFNSLHFNNFCLFENLVIQRDQFHWPLTMVHLGSVWFKRVKGEGREFNIRNGRGRRGDIFF